MTLGYTGYYLCRSNLSVALPLILGELAAGGMDPRAAKVRMGWVASIGIFGYALGKLAGGVGDFFGGRRSFLAGMAGSVVFTAVFALGGSIPFFTLAWLGNRTIQAIGWPGMVKIASRWVPHSAYGLVMGVLSLSFLWGDSAARVAMGLLLGRGLGWRGVFAVAAGTLLALLALTASLLKESPREVGLEEPLNNPANLFGAAGADPVPPGPRAVLGPLVRSPTFWLVCLLSFGLTLVRETFNTWSATYFVEAVGLRPDVAATTSALFPFVGGVSVLLAGALSDRLGRGGRAAIILGGLLLAGAALLVLGRIAPGGSRTLPVVLVAAVAFVLIGPYSFLAGAIALDLGGKRGGATASGIIDFAGYLGGGLAGVAVAELAVAHGWRGAFTALAIVAWVSSAAAAALLIEQRRPAARHSA
jgi:OPA family glycerol-3-phosphate transporter-like MFS transporter